MKKICWLLSCILMFQLLLGCSRKEEEILQPVNFYYINSEISYNTPNGVIRAEIREGAEFQDIEELLQVYLEGPASPELRNFMPLSVKLLSCAVENDSIYILLSSQFAELSGVKLTTECSAILMTVHDYLGTNTLYVRVEGSQLDDKDTFILTMDDLVLSDSVSSELPKE